MSIIFAATPLGLVGRWSTRSQEQARRNAMAACTVLTARRLERLEVEEYIAGYLAAHTTTTTEAEPAPVAPAAVRHVS
jgi:hypothetical protein